MGHLVFSQGQWGAIEAYQVTLKASQYTLIESKYWPSTQEKSVGHSLTMIRYGLYLQIL